MEPQPVSKKFNHGQKLFFITWALHGIVVFVSFIVFLVASLATRFSRPSAIHESPVDSVFQLLAFPIASPFVPWLYSYSLEGYQFVCIVASLAVNSAFWAAIVFLAWRMRNRRRSAR